MRLRRAISLVPSATDTLVALGAGGALVGISSDCDQPDPQRPLPIVTGAVLDPAMAAHDPAGTDRTVRQQLAAGLSLYTLDLDVLGSLAPEVIFAQDQCGVCAVPSSEVASGLAAQGLHCEIVSLDPVTLDEVLFTFARIGDAVGATDAGRALQASSRRRLNGLSSCRSPAAAAPAGGWPTGRAPAGSAPAGTKPRVLVLDWVDPPFAAGNWVPELVEAAGGEPILIGSHGVDRTVGVPTPSRPVTVDAVLASLPDVVVVAPCGLGLEASTEAARGVASWFTSSVAGGGNVTEPLVMAFDGRVWFSRPGPRLVEGAEALAALLRREDVSTSTGGWRVVGVEKVK